MPGCVLRAAGEFFDVDAFIAESPWRPAAVHRKGESARRHSQELLQHSGFNVVVSDREGIAAQTEDALAFLAQDAAEVERLVRILGIEGVALDFGTGFRDVVVQPESFSGALVRAAGMVGMVGIGLEVTLYPLGTETDGS